MQMAMQIFDPAVLYGLGTVRKRHATNLKELDSIQARILKKVWGLPNQIKSSVVRKEIGCIKISQKWERKVLKAIKKVEYPKSIVLQTAFEELADHKSERVRFWWEIKNLTDMVKENPQYSGLTALYCPESGDSVQEEAYAHFAVE